MARASSWPTSGTDGVFKLMTTSPLSSTISLTIDRRAEYGEPVLGSRMRFSEAMTSAGVSGLPLWNLTPCLSLKR